VFLSSLGVNTHNDQGYNASAYVAMLRYTGISAVRDGGRNLVNLIRLHQQTGALFDVFTGCDVRRTPDAARALAHANALLSIEGPNRWTTQSPTNRGWCTICCCKSQIEGSYWWSGESRYNVTVQVGAKTATVRIYAVITEMGR